MTERIEIAEDLQHFRARVQKPDGKISTYEILAPDATTAREVVEATKDEDEQSVDL